MKKKNIDYKFNNKIISKIFNLARETNTPLYLVGGIVRDILIKKPNFNDFDFSYKKNINPFINKLKEKINFKTIVFNRKNFRTIRLCFKNLIIDFQKLHKNNLKKDALKRDFTVNALYMKYNSSNKFSIIDHVGGLSHIKNKIIIPVSEKCFRDDPLRILRMYRLKATSNFEISQKAAVLSQKEIKNLNNIANERIKEELIKIFNYPDFSVLNKMIEAGVFNILFESNLKKFKIKIFKNDYLLNMLSIFYENNKIENLPNILKDYTFSKNDIKLTNIIKNIIQDTKNRVSEKKFILRYKDYQKKYIQRAFTFLKRICPEKITSKLLKKIIQNHKFIINGSILMEKFNIKGEKLGKLIDNMHTYQIKNQIKNPDKLLNVFENKKQK